MNYKKNSFTLILKLSFAFSWVFFMTQTSWAGPCCARSAAVPTLILGDDRAQLNLGLSGAGLHSIADENGQTKTPLSGEYDSLLNSRIEGALLLSDRWQLGAGFSYSYREVNWRKINGNSSHFGDTRLSLGYEFLPAWTYSRWKPQGFFFSVLTLPTGISKYELGKQLTSIDVTGNGFYSLSLGALLLKRWNSWDAFLLTEGHYSFQREFSGKVYIPGIGGSVGIGLGWSPAGSPIRLGARIQPRADHKPWESGDRTQQNYKYILNCDTGIDFSYLLSDTSSIMLSYTDQSLLGPSLDSNLMRSIAFNFQHRWER